MYSEFLKDLLQMCVWGGGGGVRPDFCLRSELVQFSYYIHKTEGPY